MQLKIKNLKLKIMSFQQGVVLLWTLLISAVLMVISFTMVLLVVKEMRISSNMDESGRAYSAAEAGMERALYFLNVENPGWCDLNASQTFNKNLDDSLNTINYDVSIKCKSLDPQSIEIESKGISNGENTRELKTTISSTSPSSIDKFDNNTGLFFPTYDSTQRDPSYTIPKTSLIIQQFDLKNFEAGSIGGLNSSFTVGMSNGNDTNFGLDFENEDGLNVKISLKGKVKSTSVSSNNFSFNPDINENYRVKIEYSRYGLNSSGYTVIRAIILKRFIDPVSNQEKFVCIDSSNSYVSYAGLNIVDKTDLSQVLVNTGQWIGGTDDNYVKIGGGIKLDNMVFWGRQ